MEKTLIIIALARLFFYVIVVTASILIFSLIGTYQQDLGYKKALEWILEINKQP